MGSSQDGILILLIDTIPPLHWLILPCQQFLVMGS